MPFADRPSDLQLLRADMKHMIMAGGTVALLLGLAAAPARAQTAVSGGVVVRSGPVTGHVEVGSPPPPVVVVREPAREVIVVERTHVPHGEAHGWWKEHGYREVTVYYDGSHYYGRQVEREGIRTVVVYQRGGRYYLGDEDGDRHHGHHGRHGDHDDN
jgi:hypothetical protein